ncbi:MAG: hypothetical protein QG639_528 [Patescibacteria group bacterium]|nr:hypothetical protein [Patescibacteria group bacterium]
MLFMVTLYFLGVLFIVIAIGLMFYGGFFNGYPLFLAGVLSFPVAWDILTKTDGKPLARWLQIVTVTGVLLYGVAT